MPQPILEAQFPNNGTPGAGKVPVGSDANGNWTWGAGAASGAGLLSARPTAAAAGAGYFYYATDTVKLYRSDGSAWTQVSSVSGGVELGYAERTSNFATSTSAAPYADVTGLSITITVASRPIMLKFWSGQGYHAVAGGAGQIRIQEGTTELALAAPSGSGANEAGPIVAMRRIAPSAGSHTYKVTLASILQVGNYNLFASATSPMFLQATEL